MTKVEVLKCDSCGVLTQRGSAHVREIKNQSLVFDLCEKCEEELRKQLNYQKTKTNNMGIYNG